MENKNLILVGGGGHCKSVLDAAESAGWTVLGVLDMPELVGKPMLSTTYVGTDDDIPVWVDKAQFLITVGQIKSSTIRKKIAARIEAAGGKYATIIASDAYVSKYAELGDGTVVLHKAVVNAGAKVGKNCIINTMANIEHDVVVGNYCHISTGALVNGGAEIGSNSFVGSGAVVVNGVKLVEGSFVKAGSLAK